jgi:hypothetical protein
VLGDAKIKIGNAQIKNSIKNASTNDTGATHKSINEPPLDPKNQYLLNMQMNNQQLLQAHTFDYKSTSLHS